MTAPFMPRILQRFARDEQGGATAFGLFLLASGLMLGGYAIDVGNVIAARTKLQVTADAAAHAALVTRELGTVAESKAAALAMVERNMPASSFGTVLTEEDIVFGTWDTQTMSFTPSALWHDAVRVDTRRMKQAGNPVATYLLKLVGLDAWDVVTPSIFTTYHPTCLREGFVAENVVDLQSNNNYFNGFCIHSNTYVSLNSNNYFEPGTIVSMPDPNQIDLPNSGFDSNVGLAQALQKGQWHIRILDRILPIIDGLETGTNHVPAYISNTIPIRLKSRTVDAASLTKGRIHTFSCGGGGAAMQIKSGTLLNEVVIVTNCRTLSPSDASCRGWHRFWRGAITGWNAGAMARPRAQTRI
jgi:Flp pilus assembly protein TadG